MMRFGKTLLKWLPEAEQGDDAPVDLVFAAMAPDAAGDGGVDVKDEDQQCCHQGTTADTGQADQEA